MSFAAGTLSDAFALVISSHLQFCRECRDRLLIMKEIGGALLLALPEDAPDDAFLTRGMQRFAAEATLPKLGNERVWLDPGNECFMPGPFAKASGLNREIVPWKPVGPGIHGYDLTLTRDCNNPFRLVRLEPGAEFRGLDGSSHLTLIFWGGYESAGEAFARGDLHDIDDGQAVSLKAGDNEEVVFVVATETSPLMRSAERSGV